MFINKHSCSFAKYLASYWDAKSQELFIMLTNVSFVFHCISILNEKKFAYETNYNYTILVAVHV